jgi:hypothetical protein
VLLDRPSRELFKEATDLVQQMQQHPHITLACILESPIQAPPVVYAAADIVIAASLSRSVNHQRRLWQCLDVTGARWASFQVFQAAYSQFAAHHHSAIVRTHQGLFHLPNPWHEHQHPIRSLVLPCQVPLQPDTATNIREEILRHGCRRAWLRLFETDVGLFDPGPLPLRGAILARDQVAWLHRRGLLAGVAITSQQASWIYEWTLLAADLRAHVSQTTPLLPMVL